MVVVVFVGGVKGGFGKHITCTQMVNGNLIIVVVCVCSEYVECASDHMNTNSRIP